MSPVLADTQFSCYTESRAYQGPRAPFVCFLVAGGFGVATDTATETVVWAVSSEIGQCMLAVKLVESAKKSKFEQGLDSDLRLLLGHLLELFRQLADGLVLLLDLFVLLLLLLRQSQHHFMQLFVGFCAQLALQLQRSQSGRVNGH
jgi:hypothetical protein